MNRAFLFGTLFLVGCSGSHASPFGALTGDAKSGVLSYCPSMTEQSGAELHDPPPVPKDIRVEKPAHLRCDGAKPGMATGDIWIDESNGNVLSLVMLVNLPAEDFDRRLDSFVKTAVDPWIKVASHEQLVQLLQHDLGDARPLSGDGWVIEGSTHLRPAMNSSDGAVAIPATKEISLAVRLTSTR